MNLRKCTACDKVVTELAFPAHFGMFYFFVSLCIIYSLICDEIDS